MKKNLWLFLFTLLFSTSIFATTKTIKHNLGETKINGVPKRVVVFDYGLLDVVDNLGGNVVGVVKGNFPQHLKKFNDNKYTNVGTLFEPNYETLIRLKPDLIIIGGRQAPLYNELSKIAPTIAFRIDGANYMNDFKNNTRVIGDVFNKKSLVENKLSSIDKDIKSLNKKTTKNNALFLMVNGNSVTVYGKGSRFDILYSIFGFQPADPNIPIDNHGNKVSFEYILSKNPDYLFYIDRAKINADNSSTISASSALNNNLIRATKAHRNKNILELSIEDWYLSAGGITTVQNMIKEMKKALK